MTLSEEYQITTFAEVARINNFDNHELGLRVYQFFNSAPASETTSLPSAL